MTARPLHGRSDTIARLLSGVRGAKNHRTGALLLVTGPAGIGKTAVLAEVCARAAALSVCVLREPADELVDADPDQPLLAVDRLAEDLAETARRGDRKSVV